MRFTRRTTLTVALLLAGVTAVSAQVRPPSVDELSRYGAPRGATTVIRIRGANLQKSSGLVFDDPRITAQVRRVRDTGELEVERDPESTAPPIADKGRTTELDVAVTVPATVERGRQAFRVRTPLGTTNLVSLWIGDLPEVMLPDEAASEPRPVEVPITVNGVLKESEGAAHTLSFDAAAGKELVFVVLAEPLGSELDARLTLRDASGRVVAAVDDAPSGSKDPVLVHRVAKAGRYTITVEDTNGTGGERHFYRLSMGELPYVTSVFPLGGPATGETSLQLEGANLGRASTRVTLSALERASRGDGRPGTATIQTDLVPFAPRATSGQATLNEIRLARGAYPEVLEAAEAARAEGQQVSVPTIINGRIEKRSDTSLVDTYRFQARKGEAIVVSVMAARVGSPLDSVIEILDEHGRPLPLATLRAVWETTVDLRDHGSTQPNMRLLSTAELAPGDYIFCDRELMRVRELPDQPDEDMRLMAFGGQRLSYLGTSGETHANVRPVYKVEVHPAGATLPPNGLPVFHLTHRNDDGGPRYGKDSRLVFTPPADGRYAVRVSDSRGSAGPRFSYRLTIAPPAPDFTLDVSPTNPNVPSGGRVPISVTAFRHDGFDGPIEVELSRLPPDMRATKGVILRGEDSVSLILAAAPRAGVRSATFSAVGRAQINGREVVRTPDFERAVALASVTTPPDVSIESVEPDVLTLEPGGRATVSVKVARHNGFAGRIPVVAQNLPYRVTVHNTGLNGVLITEKQDGRTFEVIADRGAQAVEQVVFLTARWEANSGQPTDQASFPLTLRVVGPGKNAVTGKTDAAATAVTARAAITFEDESHESAARAPEQPSSARDASPIREPSPLSRSSSTKRTAVPESTPAPAAVDVDNSARSARPWWGWVFLGRLHPVVVHFPIALLLAGLLYELVAIAKGRAVPTSIGVMAVSAGALSALVAAWFGTLNASHQTFSGVSEATVAWHRLLGWTLVGCSAIAVASAWLHRMRGAWAFRLAYLVALLMSAATVGAVGHLGGQLVHGQTYLTSVLPWNQEAAEREAERLAKATSVTTPSSSTAANGEAKGTATSSEADHRVRSLPSDTPTRPAKPSARPTPPRAEAGADASSHPPPDERRVSGASAATDESAAAIATGREATTNGTEDGDAKDVSDSAPAAAVFARDIEPIFETTCVECHGPEKQKGELRLDSVAALERGGESGALLIAGDSAGSLIVRRILGLDGEDRMPQDKDPLTPDQIRLIRRWIDRGNPFSVVETVEAPSSALGNPESK